MNVKFFVVFHYNLEDFYDKSLLDNFEFVAVNDNIQKNIKNSDLKIITESSLEGYVDYQSLRFNESSAILNLESHIKISNIDYLCFLQYDNVVDQKYLDFIKKNISENNCICPWLMDSNQIMSSSLPNMFPYFQRIVEIFNLEYNSDYNMSDIGGPMISTFVIHKNIYLEMIEFYKKSQKDIVESYINSYGTRHIAGFLERFWAIFLNLRLKNNILVSNDGFSYREDVKDVINQMWRYR